MSVGEFNLPKMEFTLSRTIGFVVLLLDSLSMNVELLVFFVTFNLDLFGMFNILGPMEKEKFNSNIMMKF